MEKKMKIIFYCCVVWTALFACYLEQNCEALLCAKKDRQNFDLFKTELAKECAGSEESKDLDLCAMLSEVYKWQASKERKSLLKAYNRYKEMNKSGPAKLALRSTVINQLNELTKGTSDFRHLKEKDTILFKALWFLYEAIVFIGNPRFIKMMDEGYRALELHAEGVARKFFENLNPDPDAKTDLSLYRYDTMISKGIKDELKLAEDVYNRFGMEVTKYSKECFGNRYSALVLKTINMDEIRFRRFVATKNQNCKFTLDNDISWMHSRYRSVIMKYAGNLRKEYEKKSERNADEDEFLTLYEAAKWIGWET